MPEFVCEEVTSPLGDAYATMVFPSYRPFLPLVGSGEVGPNGIRPIARSARLGRRPVGLAIARLPKDGETAAELLSIYVVDPIRNAGVGEELLEGLERDLIKRGVPELTAVYMTGKASIPALERVFEKRGFAAPVRRTIAVRFLPEEPAQCVWYQKARMPAGATIFPWTELTPEERAWLISSQAERNWIEPELEPWRFDDGFEPLSSVGMRKDGEVVGWAINHLIAPNLVRFTVAFMRRDLSARGASFPLYVESLKRLEGTGVTCTFVTAANFTSMNKFVLRRVCPYVRFCGETRGISKQLA